MKMPFRFAEGLQGRLAEYLPVDRPSPEHWAGSLCEIGEVPGRREWQLAVDLFYRLLVCDLVQLWPEGYLGKAGKYTFDGPLDFCQALAQQNPYSFEETSQMPVPWIGPNIGMTDKLRELLKKHDMVLTKENRWPHTWPLNEAFIEDIESIFEAHGVDWSDEPLIPIRAETAKT